MENKEKKNSFLKTIVGVAVLFYKILNSLLKTATATKTRRHQEAARQDKKILGDTVYSIISFSFKIGLIDFIHPIVRAPQG